MKTNHDIETLLSEVRDQRWSGSQQDERVEQLIREVTQMEHAKQGRFTKGSMLAIGLGCLIGGGAVAGVVTHQVMSQRVTLVDQDGNRFTGEFTPIEGGGAGVIVTDQGAEYLFEKFESGEQVKVQVTAEGVQSDGSATLTVEESDG